VLGGEHVGDLKGLCSSDKKKRGKNRGMESRLQVYVAKENVVSNWGCEKSTGLKRKKTGGCVNCRERSK